MRTVTKLAVTVHGRDELQVLVTGYMQTAGFMEGSDIERIAQELRHLLDQQMKAISGRGFDDLTEQELKEYEQRRERIAVLRAKLAEFERPS